MKKTLMWIAVVVAASAHFALAETNALSLQAPQTALASASTSAPQTDFAAQPQQIQAASMTADFFTRFHYKALPLDDVMSEKIFDRYLKSLDSEKVYFLQADIDRFASERTRMDDAILGQDLTTPFSMFKLYHERFLERYTFARNVLKQEFDFTRDEAYVYTREKETWMTSAEALNEHWRKRVMNDWLRLKLAGKDAAAIRTTLDKRYETAINRGNKIKNEDVFQLFMNAYATSIDPHTNYLNPKAAEDFDISMRLSITGIGATLQDRDEMTTIRELTPGGPAILSGKLKVGDRIVGVGQASASAVVDVMGWRLDDVVALIRGPKDTTVVLDVLPVDAGPDGKHKTISLVRNKISLEQQAAKKSILEVKNPDGVKHVGVIALPAFYLDFDARRRGDKDYKSATRDVARILAEFKKEKVDSILVDLRDNGGGSLSEAIELTSLFIGHGPVVQQRNSHGRVQVESDKGGHVVWEGPMGVMINHGSASASEIFAAAIQDYGRGLIIGESSFGKGTVQTVVNLDEMARSEKPLYGDLKMTVAQFFRVNGGTTQLRGVIPDIAYPSYVDSDTYGEASFDNALPWVQIKPAEYKAVGNLKDVQTLLQMRHELRIAKDKEFQFIKEDIAEYQQQKAKTSISLNENERRSEREMREKKIKAREMIRAALNGKSKDGEKANRALNRLNTQDDGLQGNERSLAAEIAAEKANKDAKDVYLLEAAHILGDELELIKSDRKIAAQVISRFGVRAKDISKGN